MKPEWLDVAEIVKITHVAEIVNIGHVARILEAEICGAENMRAIPMYNHIMQCRARSLQKIWASGAGVRFGPPWPITISFQS